MSAPAPQSIVQCNPPGNSEVLLTLAAQAFLEDPVPHGIFRVNVDCGHGCN